MKDARGLSLTVSDPAALDLFEQSLAGFRSYRGDPTAPLDEAIARDPGFAAAYAVKALILMTFFERRFAHAALETLEAGAPALARALPRERALAEAARLLAQGEWHRGGQALERILVDHPRDIVALQVAHLMDFMRGDALNLRNRISRVLPHWSPATTGHSFVLGMHAFGLEESNQYPEAEAAARAALDAAPEDCWATHALTHVFEMQARIDEGAAFLESTTGDWATPDNGFAFHNWWHLALFHLDRADYAAAIAIYDRALTGALAMAISRVDATALLWRLRLEGVDVGNRFEPVADAWEQDLDAEGGFYAFNDSHAALAFAATGRSKATTRLRAVLERSAGEAGANAEMARVVGIDASEAAFAFCEGRNTDAVERLLSVRDGSWRFGGSHAQRDLLTLTLIEAARRAGSKGLAAHYANERRVHRPHSQWGVRLSERIAAPAKEPAAVA